MADSILNIVIRARDETQAAFVQLQQQLKSIDNSLKDINKGDISGGLKEGFEQVGKSAQETQGHIKNLSQQVKDSALDFEVLRSAANKVAGLFAGFFTVSFIKGLADGAARTQVLGTVLEQVAANAGITAEYIKQVDRQVQALGITAEASRQSLSQFIQSGLDITKAASLARAAQDLAVISGRDSSETFSRLVTSTQQMNTVSLRWMGIIVDVEQAVQKYASAHDVAAASVSKATKQQIVLNEVLDQAEKLAGLYEKSMFDVGKQLQSLDRYQKEAGDSAGEVLLPAYLVLVEEFTLFLKQLKLVTDGWNATSDAAGGLADTIKPIASALREVMLFAIQNGVALAELALTMYLVIKAGAITTTVLTAMAGAMSYLLLGIQYLRTAWVGLTVAFAANPFGVVLITVGLLITAITALWNILAKKPKTDEAELATGYVILLDLEEKLLASKRKLQDAQKGKGSVSLKEAQDEVDSIKEQIKAQQEKNEKMESGVKGGNVAVKIAREQAAEMAAIKKEGIEATKAIDDTNTALTKMGISTQSARKGLNISVGFEEQMSNFQKFIEQYREGLNKNEEEQLVTLGQIDLMAKKIAEGAKTADEMRAALDRLGNEGSLTRGKLEPLLRALELREAKAGIEETQKAMAKFTENSQAATHTLQILSSAEQTSKDAATSLARELLKIGVGINEQAQGLDALTSKLTVTSATQRALASVEVRALEETGNAIEKKYKRELEQVEAVRSARINAANALTGNSRGTQAAVLDAEKKAATDSINAAKTKFDAIAQLQAKYLQLAIGTANEIKKLDDAIFDSKKTLEEKLFDLKLKGKTEEEQQALILRRIQEAGSQAEAARMQGNFDLAKKLNDERIALVGKLATGNEEQVTLVQNKTKEAYAQQTNILKDQKAIKEETLQDEVRGYAEVTKKLEEITAKLAEFANEQTVKLSVELDSNSLDTVVSQIKEALSDITMTLRVKTEGFAAGGLVDTQKIQGYATGGLVNMQNIQKYAKGGLVTLKNFITNAAGVAGVMGLASAAVAHPTTISNATTMGDSTTNAVTLGDHITTLGNQISEVINNQHTNITEVNNTHNAGDSFSEITNAVGTVVKAFAGGGLVLGPGTTKSDSILAALSNQEFVMNADAVSRYGVRFMEAINNMTLPHIPKFAAGGLVGSPAGGDAASVGGTRDVVDVNFNMGGQKISLMGERMQVRKLVSSLKNMQGA